MRRHPQSLRAVVMKGIVPPSMAAPEGHAPAGETAWQALVARCARDPECARIFPNVDADFRQLLARLEQNPPVLVVSGNPDRAATAVRVTRGLFAEAFRNVLYSPEGSAEAPQLVRQLLGGDERLLAERALAARQLFGGARLAAGFFLSVSCAEDIPFLPADAEARAATTFGGTYRLDQQRAACREWPRGSVSPSHRQPTTSAVPSLLLSGALDPVTPASGADEVVRGLTNGRHVVIRNNGHPIGNAERCIEQMIGAFLDRGSPANIDVGCAAAIPAVPFQLPSGNQLPPSAPAYGAFAFSNPAGTEFIVLHDVPNPGRLRSAICSGDVKPVEFARLQKGAGADRHWPDQFASLTGSVFRVVNGGANAGDACVLAPESLLTGAQVVRTRNSSTHSPCAAVDQRRIQSLRERRIQACWSLGTVQPRGSITAVEWARQDADALASIVIDVDGRAMAIDLPAKYTRAGEDLWRVDDEGKFGADGITIPFLIRRGGVFTIPMRWNGAESVSLSLFVSDETGMQDPSGLVRQLVPRPAVVFTHWAGTEAFPAVRTGTELRPDRPFKSALETAASVPESRRRLDSRRGQLASGIRAAHRSPAGRRSPRPDSRAADSGPSARHRGSGAGLVVVSQPSLVRNTSCAVAGAPDCCGSGAPAQAVVTTARHARTVSRFTAPIVPSSSRPVVSTHDLNARVSPVGATCRITRRRSA